MNLVPTIEEALERVGPASHILLHSACAEPQTLVEELIKGIREDRANLNGTTVYALTYRSAGAPAPLYADVALLREQKLFLKSFFPHSSLKEAAKAGLVDYIPASLSMLPRLIREGRIPINAAFLQVTPPDQNGRCSTGPASDLIEALLSKKVKLIGEMNSRLPYTYGTTIGADKFDVLVESDRPIIEMAAPPSGPVEKAVAANVVELIKDGSTLQFGVGSVPEAVLELLTARRNLNLHSGAFTDRVVDLFEAGAITNSSKPLDKGKSVAGLLLGTKKLFDFANRNQAIFMAPADYCNNPVVVAKLPNFVSINSALEIDYTGQVNSEALGDWQLAGVGGQLDYIQGAWSSENGISILALPSATPSGKPRIVPRLPQGAPVSTPRHMVQVVVTEKGVADLRGKSLSEREKLLKTIS